MSVHVTGWHVQPLEDVLAWKGTALPRALREAQRRPWWSVHKAAPHSISFLMDGGGFTVAAYICCSEPGKVSLGTEETEKSKHLTLSRTSVSHICCSFQGAGMLPRFPTGLTLQPSSVVSVRTRAVQSFGQYSGSQVVALTSSVSITFLR